VTEGTTMASWNGPNEAVLAKVEEDRQIIKIIQQRLHHCIVDILRHQSLLLNIIKEE